MRILVTGDYNPDYNRTRILLKGLKEDSRVKLTEYPIESFRHFDKQAFRDLARDADFLYLPPFTHNSVSKLSRLTDKPIVFDPLISKYLTKVFDYQEVHKYSLRALKNYLKDRVPLRKSDLILADTEAHKTYFNQTFKVSLDKIKVLQIGADVTQFMPVDRPDNSNFTVGFYGGFIPLQGTQHIIKAAEILQTESEIQFQLIGTGFEWERMKQMAAKLNLGNVNFQGWVAYEELSERINGFDICLGIFGDTPKADLVIPNKVYHYAALKKCTITKATPAIKELFTDDKNIVLTTNDPRAIAEQILKLKNDVNRTERIAAEAYQLITQNYNEHKIAERFIFHLEDYRHA